MEESVTLAARSPLYDRNSRERLLVCPHAVSQYPPAGLPPTPSAPVRPSLASALGALLTLALDGHASLAARDSRTVGRAGQRADVRFRVRRSRSSFSEPAAHPFAARHSLVLETSYGVSACCLPQTLLQCSSTVLQFTQSGSYLDAQKVCTYKPLAAGTYIQFSAPSFMSYVPAIELFGVPGEAGNVKNSSTAGGLGAQVRLGGTWGAPFSLVVPSVTP